MLRAFALGASSGTRERYRQQMPTKSLAVGVLSRDSGGGAEHGRMRAPILTQKRDLPFLPLPPLHGEGGPGEARWVGCAEFAVALHCLA